VDHTILIVTNSAVYLSRDAGSTWPYRTDAPNALCLAVTPTFLPEDPILVGLAEQGLLRLTHNLT
jgi:hypothetical protein